MKKITVLIGCWVGQFVKEIKFFEHLEKKLKCKVVRKSKFVYETEINDNKITFQFCFGPDNDKIWKERKEIRSKEGSSLPPSIGHLVKKGIKADEIYYLGLCGVFKGKHYDVFLPNEFIKISFDKYTIHHGHLDKLEISKKIKHDNKLIGVIPGKKCSVVTSNQVLSLKYVKNRSHELLKALSKKLKTHADVVEMENYEIVKNFGNKHNIGILLFGTDKPANKEKKSKTEPRRTNWIKFNKVGIEMIRKITA